MTGDDGRGCFSCRTVVVMFVLSSLAKPYTCFSLLGLNENVKQDKIFGEAAMMEVKTGIVLFNGREIRSRPWPASAAATGSDGLLHIDSYLSDGTRMLEQQPAVKGAMVNEAAWRHMKPSLHCGGDQLKFRVVGPGSSQFALEQENAPPIPLSQVPSSCGYSMQKNSLALVLLVPYDGCNMVQEGENYILSLLWRGIPISLCCQNLMAHTLATAAPTSPAKPEPATKEVPASTAPPATAGATTSAPVTETAATTTKPIAPPKNPEMPAFPNFPYFYPPMFPYFQPPQALATVTPATTSPPITETAATATTKPVAPMQKPEMPVFPNFPYYPSMFPYFQPPQALATVTPATTSPPITETAATATTKPVAPMQKPEMPVFPNFPYYPSMFPYFQPPQALATVTPATTSPPITETAATATTKPVAPMQKPEMPVFPNFPYYPSMFPYFQPPPPAATEVPTTTAEPTTTTTKSTTTTNSANPSETDSLQMLPFPFPPYSPQYPWPFPESLPAMSKLESPAFPPHMAALGYYPHYMFSPHALPASTQNPPLKPEPALPTTMPTTNPESHPQGQVAVEFFPFGNPFGPSPF